MINVTDNSAFYVKFWGVRGSIACPGEQTLRYGGNTSCVQVVCDGHTVILDAGTGLRVLGDELVKQGVIDVDLFLSHTHVDHLTGFPFFKPAYIKGNSLNVHAGHLLSGGSNVKAEIDKFMSQPLFPISTDIMAAKMEFLDFSAGDMFMLEHDIAMHTAPLNHPNGATGYRIEYKGKSVCYVTDTEHVEGEPDSYILDLIEGADVFIYDSTYTDEEYPNYKGWGHSTWQEGARLSDMANVKTFVAFHHDPSHDDAFMDEVALQLSTFRKNGKGIVAKEGMALNI